MTIITITVDETNPTQDIYSPELDRFLHIDLLAQADIDNQTKALVDKVQTAQAAINTLATLTTTRTIAQPSAQQAQVLP